MSSRVGIGYDSHRLAEGRRLIIGGVEIPFERGLDGHSDADVLTHAITDADPRRGRRRDIGRTSRRPTSAGGTPTRRAAPQRARATPRAGRNVDATVICERPPIGPHREAIEAMLSAAVGAPVSVKATTNEGLGAIGREEGIAAIAVAAFAARR